MKEYISKEHLVMKKTVKVINSCQTKGQAWTASRYARLACDKYPGIYCTVREALTRVECNFSRVKMGRDPWPLITI